MTDSDPWRSSEVEDLVKTLRSTGVLTRDALRERSGADRWPDHGFDEALIRGVEDGDLKQLGNDLFEAG